ncbi:transglycosylase family protein [Kitasatospora aureofaciens]|uniref:transglycosylase family protein n=1 Tax=Kitasatospora aureofaciens TaxID=1894 RepID=UPI0033FFAC6F
MRGFARLPEWRGSCEATGNWAVDSGNGFYGGLRLQRPGSVRPAGPGPAVGGRAVRRCWCGPAVCPRSRR